MDRIQAPAASSWVIRLARRADGVDLDLCLAINRAGSHPLTRGLFAGVSRLGDGVFWYGLMAALPFLFGDAGLECALRMAGAGLLGLALYRYLKARFGRERPFVASGRVRAGGRALDRYSFPSGHTLHAVSFNTIAFAVLPGLGWALAPFTVLVALSRPALGLHYPGDVLAGGLIGYAVARLVLLA